MKPAPSHQRTGTRTRQLELPLPNTWGGARAGAGRKPGVGRRPVPHRARPAHAGRHPVHVALRSAFRPLRSQFVFPTLRRAISGAERRRKGSFRVTHFSAQFDHLHLIVEADTRAALLAGIRGLSISIARAINQLVNRKGRLWSDRWHGHTLTTPRATRHAIAYVVGNFRKHTRERWMIDPYSSAPYFCGFREFDGHLPISADPRLVPQALAPPRESPVSLPHTWLLRIGWRRAGLLSVFAAPSSSRS